MRRSLCAGRARCADVHAQGGRRHRPPAPPAADARARAVPDHVAFGLGYRESPDRKTLFVTADGSPLTGRSTSTRGSSAASSTSSAPPTDDAAARPALDRGDVDVVVEFPADPARPRARRQAVEDHGVHTRLDPIEQTAIDFASPLAVDQINGQILASIVDAGSAGGPPFGDVFAAASTRCSRQPGRRQRRSRRRPTGRCRSRRRQLVHLRRRCGGSSGSPTSSSSRRPATLAGPSSTAQRLPTALEAGRTLQQTLAGGDAATAAEQLADIDQTLSTVQQLRRRYDRRGDPCSCTRSRRGGGGRARHAPITDLYAPTAVVLLVQQFGVAFGALSFVRERPSAPSSCTRPARSAGPMVIGKFLGLPALGGVMAAVLVELVVLVLDVPLRAAGRRGRRDRTDAVRFDRSRFVISLRVAAPTRRRSSTP